MRIELRDLSKRLNVTTLFVTHEQLEALSMSDVVAVMKDGRIVQSGTPAEIYNQPRSAFVAQFIGRTNILKAEVKERDGDGSHLLVQTSMGLIRSAACEGGNSDDSVIIAIRPEDVEIVAPGEPHGENVFHGEVERLLFLGECIEAHVHIGPQAFTLRMHPSQVPSAGDSLRIRLPPDRCRALPSDS